MHPRPRVPQLAVGKAGTHASVGIGLEAVGCPPACSSAAHPSPRWADDACPKMDAQGGAHRALPKSEPALRALRSELGRSRGPTASARPYLWHMAPASCIHNRPSHLPTAPILLTASC